MNAHVGRWVRSPTAPSPGIGAHPAAAAVRRWSYGGCPACARLPNDVIPRDPPPAPRLAGGRPPAAHTPIARTRLMEVSMKFRVARDDLADAVAWVAKSLPARPPVPVLGGILLQVNGSTLTVAGFDYEVSTRATLSVDALDELDADTTAPGTDRVLVSGRLLAEITRALPAKPVDLAVVGPKVSIVAGSARFTLPTMPVEDYPPLPQMPSSSGTVDSAVFAEAVAQTAVAAGRDDTLPMLTGIRVEIEGATL